MAPAQYSGAVLASKTPLWPARSGHRYRAAGRVPGIGLIRLNHRRGDSRGRRPRCCNLSANVSIEVPVALSEAELLVKLSSDLFEPLRISENIAQAFARI